MKKFKNIMELNREEISAEYELIRQKVNERPRTQRDHIVKIHLRNEYERITGNKIKNFK